MEEESADSLELSSVYQHEVARARTGILESTSYTPLDYTENPQAEAYGFNAVLKPENVETEFPRFSL